MEVSTYTKLDNKIESSSLATVDGITAVGILMGAATVGMMILLYATTLLRGDSDYSGRVAESIQGFLIGGAIILVTSIVIRMLISRTADRNTATAKIVGLRWDTYIRYFKTDNLKPDGESHLFGTGKDVTFPERLQGVAQTDVKYAIQISYKDKVHTIPVNKEIWDLAEINQEVLLYKNWAGSPDRLAI